MPTKPPKPRTPPARIAEPTYRPITDVAADLGERKSVIRWWEDQFRQVRPMRARGGHRRYDRETVDLLRGIQRLLRIEGLSIAGVRQALEQQGPAAVRAIGRRVDGKGKRADARRLASGHARPAPA